jgi:hypothetical protein
MSRTTGVRAARIRPAAAIAVSVLAAAGCTGGRPSNPVSSVPAPQIRPLGSAIILEPLVSRMRVPPAPGQVGRFTCRPGFAFLPGPGANPTLCYRQIGKPVTITSAAVFSIEDLPQNWGLAITVPPGDRAALAAVSTRAVGHQLAIIVAGKAWAIVYGQTPLTHGRFEILGLTRTGVSALRRMLVQSG